MLQGSKGFLKGGTFGFSDEIIGGLTGLVGGDGKAAMNDVRLMQEAAAKSNPKSFIAGEFIGGGAMGGAGLARQGAVKGGAIAGGVYGAGDAEGNILERADNAAIGAGLGALGGKAFDLAGAQISKLFAKGKLVVNGRLTNEAAELLKRAGVEPDELTPDDMQEIVALAKKNIDPEQALRIVDAKSLPEPVNLTQGQMARDNETLRLELLAGDSNAFGARANQIANETRRQQDTAIQRNALALRQRLGGDGAPVDLTDGGVAVAKRLNADAMAAKSAAASVREDAKGGIATAPKSVLSNIVGEVKSDFANNGIVAGNEIYDTVNSQFLTRANKIIEAGKRGETPVQAIMQLRRDVSSASSSARGPASERLGRIATQIDDAMEQALDQAVIKGDARLFRNA